MRRITSTIADFLNDPAGELLAALVGLLLLTGLAVAISIVAGDAFLTGVAVTAAVLAVSLLAWLLDLVPHRRTHC